jgi:prepilin-type N-terminal cleavage/methylation domain-containing protein
VAAASHCADDEDVILRSAVPSRRDRVLRLLRGERGVSLIELLTSMAIMSFILASLATVFVSGSNAEVDLRNRFAAQTDARLALDKMRREVHNACTATVSLPSGSAYAAVTLWSEDAAAGYTCTNAATWCAVGTGQRFALYRKAGTTCNATGSVRWADYLTSDALFTLVAASAGTLPKVGVEVEIDTMTADTSRRYRLQDAIAVRNYLRS